MDQRLLPVPSLTPAEIDHRRRRHADLIGGHGPEFLAASSLNSSVLTADGRLLLDVRLDPTRAPVGYSGGVDLDRAGHARVVPTLLDEQLAYDGHAELAAALRDIAPAGLDTVALTESGVEAGLLCRRLVETTNRSGDIVSLSNAPYLRPPELGAGRCATPGDDEGLAALVAAETPSAVVVDAASLLLRDEEAAHLSARLAWLRAEGVLVFADERRVPIAVAGRWHVCTAWDVALDGMLLGNGVGAGLPTGGLVVRAEHRDRLEGPPLTGLHPLACSTALRVLEELRSAGAPDQCATVVDDLLRRTRSIVGHFEPLVSDLATVGSVLGVRALDAPTASEIVAILLRRGVLATCRGSEVVFQLRSSTTPIEIDVLVGCLRAALADVRTTKAAPSDPSDLPTRSCCDPVRAGS